MVRLTAFAKATTVKKADATIPRTWGPALAELEPDLHAPYISVGISAAST